MSMTNTCSEYGVQYTDTHAIDNAYKYVKGMIIERRGCRVKDRI